MRVAPTRRVIVLSSALFATALLAAGCSSAADDAVADPATSQAASGHQVEHARGTTEVPADPQRVVVLEPVELDTAVALGVTPVGAAVASNVAGIPSYLGVDGIEPVGTVPEPDLEAIAALAPDLILGTESRHSELYDQLSSIAPTVFMATQADPWRENVLLVGEALNQADAAQTLVDDFDARCEQIATDVDLEGTTANLVRPRDETTLSLYGPTSFGGGALECVGLTIPEQDWEDGLQADLSPENIAQAAADHLFVTTSDVDDPTTIPAAITDNSALFGTITPVDTSYWVSGVGPIGGDLVLDDIEQFLTDQQ